MNKDLEFSAYVIKEAAINVMKDMTPEERMEFFRELEEHYCELCGNNQPCFCSPAYDE